MPTVPMRDVYDTAPSGNGVVLEQQLMQVTETAMQHLTGGSAVELNKALEIAAAGMRAQGTRLRVVAENLANANSTGETPDDLPYRRQVVTFRNVFDRQLGADTVRANRITQDTSAFQRRYEPGHPSADAEGYVLYPNVNALIEMMDMREAQRSYEANLSMVDMSRNMIRQTIDLLRN